LREKSNCLGGRSKRSVESHINFSIYVELLSEPGQKGVPPPLGIGTGRKPLDIPKPTQSARLTYAASLQTKGGARICGDVAVACCVFEIRRSVASRAASSSLVGWSPALPRWTGGAVVGLALAMIGAHRAA
jgi:hypothetical protein